MDHRILPVDLRLVRVDLHCAGLTQMLPEAFVGLRLILVDHRILPVDIRLVLVELHPESPYPFWFFEFRAKLATDDDDGNDEKGVTGSDSTPADDGNNDRQDSFKHAL